MAIWGVIIILALVIACLVVNKYYFNNQNKNLYRIEGVIIDKCHSDGYLQMLPMPNCMFIPIYHPEVWFLEIEFKSFRNGRMKKFELKKTEESLKSYRIGDKIKIVVRWKDA